MVESFILIRYIADQKWLLSNDLMKVSYPFRFYAAEDVEERHHAAEILRLMKLMFIMLFMSKYFKK